MSACAAGLASLGLLPLRSGAADSLGSQEFAAMVGDRFYLAGHNGSDGGTVRMTGVEPVGSSPKLDQFHLHFYGRPWEQIPEGLYSVSNWNGHPNFDVHVQPAGVGRRRKKLYIASFARLR